MDFYDITLFFLYENDLQNCYFRFLCSKCCFFSKKTAFYSDTTTIPKQFKEQNSIKI